MKKLLINLVVAPFAAYIALVATAGCSPTLTTRLNEPTTVITVGTVQIREEVASAPDYIEHPVATVEPEESAIALNTGE